MNTVSGLRIVIVSSVVVVRTLWFLELLFGVDLVIQAGNVFDRGAETEVVVVAAAEILRWGSLNSNRVESDGVVERISGSSNNLIRKSGLKNVCLCESEHCEVAVVCV